MKKRQIFLILPFLYIVPLSLLNSGCGSANTLRGESSGAQAQGVAESTDESLITDSLGDSLAMASDAIDSTDSIPESIPAIDEFISQSKQALVLEDFETANDILRRACEELDADLLQSPELEQVVQQYYSEISSIFAIQMPPRYLENLPDEISVTVFHTQLSAALDSMNVSPVDSALFSGIVTQKNISYDIPVTWNNRVARSLIFLSRGKKGPFGKWLNQAAYYLPLMKPLFAQKGLPTDLAYLPLIESGFNSRAYSFAHASGIWQFIPSTGVYYGLRINYWLDERRDPIKATNAAISYLQKLYTEFGDWYLALAGYNCGERNVYRAFQKNLSYSFWELDVPGETKNYVPQFIAAVVVAKNAGFFGFTVDTSMVFDLDTVYISKCIDLKTIADSLSISLPELRDMNPHILHWCTPPDLKNVVLYLPHDKGVLFKEFYDRLPPGHATMLYSYRVGRGDNLGSLSRRFGVPVDVIKQLNKLRSNSLKVKSIVLLPIPQNPETGQPIALNKASSSVSSRPSTLNGLKAVRYRVRPKDTMWSLAKLFNVSIENICRWNNLRPKSTLKSGSVLVFYTSTKSIKSLPKSTAGTRAGRTRYLVKSGDNLSTVALRLGVSVTDLILWNNKSQRNPVIQPGEQLVYFK